MFFRSGVDPDGVAEELDRWADRLGADSHLEVRHIAGGDWDLAILVTGSIQMPDGAAIRVTIQVASDGSATQYQLNLDGPEGGRPRMMWHRHPGHARDHGTDAHVHRRGQPDPTVDEDRGFASLRTAVEEELWKQT